MHNREASSLGDVVTFRGVSYRRHNTKVRRHASEAGRLRALADLIDEACAHTGSRDRAVYLQLRLIWREVERSALLEERARLSASTLLEPGFFPDRVSW